MKTGHCTTFRKITKHIADDNSFLYTNRRTVPGNIKAPLDVFNILSDENRLKFFLMLK